MNSVSQPKLLIVILAAGFSARLGQPKVLARVHGLSLFRRTLLIAAGLPAVAVSAVVARASQRLRVEARGVRVHFAVNRLRAHGLSSSVRRGVALGGYRPAVLLLPVDLALLRRRDLERLVDTWRTHPRRVCARRIGRHGGAPLILPRGFRRRIGELRGDVGLRDWLARLSPAERVLRDLPSAHVDIDTPAELAAVRRRWRG
jgi:molybdenum cofactor cytidylyltransferase